MLSRRRLLAHASLGVATIVLGTEVTSRSAAATKVKRQSHKPKNRRHDRGGRRQSDSAKMVPMGR